MSASALLIGAIVLVTQFTSGSTASTAGSAANSQVSSVAVSSDGRLASAQSDGSVLLWSPLLPIESVQPLYPYFCGIVSRNLTRAEWQEFLPGRPYHKTCADYPVGV